MHKEKKFSASEALTFWWWVFLRSEDASPHMVQHQSTGRAIQHRVFVTRVRKSHNF